MSELQRPLHGTDIDDEQLDKVARHLRQANTLEAIAQGIRVGQAAIDEVLAGGPKVLGEKPK